MVPLARIAGFPKTLRVWFDLMVLAAVGIAWTLLVFADAFATIILPKTVSRGFRLTQVFYGIWWNTTKAIAKRLVGDTRESFLGIASPLSTIALIAFWAVSLIFSFALIHYGMGTPMSDEGDGYASYLYVSATTFFTLGYGDLTATNMVGRAILMVEAGVGFGFLAVVIGFLPVFYQSFSNRERTELLLDARAGAPPMAGELLRSKETTSPVCVNSLPSTSGGPLPCWRTFSRILSSPFIVRSTLSCRGLRALSALPMQAPL